MAGDGRDFMSASQRFLHNALPDHAGGANDCDFHNRVP
jgi:hypothetical protein